MILNLTDRRSPLDGPASRLRRLLRLGFSLGLVLAAIAGGLHLAGRLRPALERPRPAAAPPGQGSPEAAWDPAATKLSAHGPTDVYREPWVESGRLGRLRKGELAAVLRNEGSWVLVDTRFGPGWVDTSPWRVRARPRGTPWTVVLPPSYSPAPTSTPSLPAPEPPALAAQEAPVPTPLPVQERLAQEVAERREESPAITWARERISRGGLQQLESQNFRLYTDLSDSSRMGFLLGLAEQTRRRFRALFEPHFELDELSGRSEMYLFRRRADYLQFYRLFANAEEAASPSGHYSIDLRTIALSEQSVPGNSVAATLVHEMVHLLLDQSLYGGTTQPRPWIGEGLACVLAYTAGVEEGRIAQVQSRSDPLGVGVAAEGRLWQVQEELRHGVGLRLRTLLQAENAAFLGPAGTRFYDAAWLLCHFLLYGEGGRHRPLLFAAITGDRAGAIPDSTLEQIERLDPLWRQYVLHLRRR
jgi:hypothetical protein